MKPKVHVYLGVSLDGYIAGNEGDLSWLDKIPPPPGEDFGFQKFLEGMDCLFMGRNTYEAIKDFPDWHYGSQKVYVLTSRPIDWKGVWKDRAETLDLSPEDLLKYAEEKGYNHIYLDGGMTIHRFLDAGLVDEMTLSILPILLGGGTLLFGTRKTGQIWTLVSSRSYSNGFVQSHYRYSGEF
ncbi:MAG: dihydrofolate reductase family protein [Leptospiraceae bacterium]|nr:dihydrofolate reductase family protein [Leptospiraceae bacterium]MCP5513398.1 dihydrofolate reductase family protein [Leptospiraceae bacterium]